MISFYKKVSLCVQIFFNANKYGSFVTQTENMSTKICVQMSNYLFNILQYNNIFSWKRSFKLNSCSIGFAQVSNILHGAICNNGLQLKAANYCCITFHLKYLWESIICMCMFKRLYQKCFVTIR